MSPSEHTCSSGCDHSLDDPHRGSQESLFNSIDLDNIVLFNASPSSSKTVIRPWFERFNIAPEGRMSTTTGAVAAVVESDCDAQLIVKIPFTASIKLKSIIIYSSHGIHCPKTMKAFINREDVDFDSVDSIDVDQEWELARIPDQGIRLPMQLPEYNTRISKFSGVRTLTLFFPDNFTNDEDEPTRLDFIGLKGEFTAFTRDPIITTYEASANPADHKKVGADNGAFNTII